MCEYLHFIAFCLSMSSIANHRDLFCRCLFCRFRVNVLFYLRVVSVFGYFTAYWLFFVFLISCFCLLLGSETVFISGRPC